MSNEYRVDTTGNQFTVIDPWDEQVDVYATEAAAKHVERCKREDKMFETPKQLVDTAVKRCKSKYGTAESAPAQGEISATVAYAQALATFAAAHSLALSAKEWATRGPGTQL
jgi:hypothetical protein